MIFRVAKDFQPPHNSDFHFCIFCKFALNNLIFSQTAFNKMLNKIRKKFLYPSKNLIPFVLVQLQKRNNRKNVNPELSQNSWKL